MNPVEHYLIEKAKVSSMIKVLHPKWQTEEGYRLDGLFNPERYFSAKIKIAIVLGETYGYDKEGETDDCDQSFENDIIGLANASVQTPRKVASLIWSINRAMEINRHVTWDDLPWLFKTDDENLKRLNDTISSIGYVNVKKASNPGNETVRLEHDEVVKHGIRNKDVLIRQINSMAPDLLIACSKPVHQVLHEIGILGQNSAYGDKGSIITNDSGLPIMLTSHPSYFKEWGYGGIVNYANRVFDFFDQKKRN